VGKQKGYLSADQEQQLAEKRKEAHGQRRIKANVIVVQAQENVAVAMARV
jgi:hypothetical protein